MPFDAAAVAPQAQARDRDLARDPRRRGPTLAALTDVHGAQLPDRLGASHDWILLYVEDRAGLEAALPAAARALASPGTLWIAYPKGSSKRGTDLTRDRGWDAVNDAHLMWLSLVSIDETWSAFSLRRYKPGEARQTFR